MVNQLGELQAVFSFIDKQIEDLRSSKKGFIEQLMAAKQAEGWIRLVSYADEQWGEVYCDGSEYLISPESKKVFYSYIEKQYVSSRGRVNQWLKENNNNPEVMARLLYDFRFIMLKEHPENVIQIDRL